MTVLFIMLLHAIPVFLIGIWLDDENLVIVPAVISGVIGIFTGSLSWLLADLFAVFLAYHAAVLWISSGSTNSYGVRSHQSNNRAPDLPIEKPSLHPAPDEKTIQSSQKEQKSESGFGFVMLIIAVLIGVYIYNENQAGLSQNGDNKQPITKESEKDSSITTENYRERIKCNRNTDGVIECHDAIQK